MKKMISLLMTILVVFGFGLTLSGCGYHKCDKRSEENPDYIEDYALEYGLTDYTNYSSFFMDIEVVAEFLEGERVSVTPEQNHRLLYEVDDRLNKFLYVTDCTEDDIYYYEVVLPTFDEAQVILDHYLSDNPFDEEVTISITTEDVVRFEHIRYVDVLKEDYFSPITYLLGRVSTEDYTENLYMVVTAEQEYAIVSHHRSGQAYTEDYTNYTTVLVDFTLNDVLPRD